MATHRGRCLCGAVRFEARVSRHEVDACHCGMCRRWGGGPALSVMTDGPARFEDEAALGVYRSSEWAERLFCRTCGTSILWRSIDGRFHTLSAALLDEPGELAFTTEIYIDAKPSWYAFAGERTRMTEAEVVAALAEEGSGKVPG